MFRKWIDVHHHYDQSEQSSCKHLASLSTLPVNRFSSCYKHLFRFPPAQGHDANELRHHENSVADIADYPIHSLCEPLSRNRATPNDFPVSLLEVLRLKVERFSDFLWIQGAGKILLVCEHQQ